MNTRFSRSRSGASRPSRLLTPMAAAMALILVVLMGGCSKSNEQTTLELLSTVPADAEMVGVLNLNTLVGQTGGKVKDGSIVEADALKQTCAQIHSALGIAAPKIHELLLSPDSGVECTSLVAFSYKGKRYLSGVVDDAAKLIQGIDKIAPGEWESDGKLKYKDDFVLRDDRFWFADGLEESTVSTFANLSEVESFRSNAYAPTLSAATDAVAFWGSIDGLLKAGGFSFSEQTMARMALGMCFNSPKCLAGSANVEKETFSASVRVLDADLKPAKCELAVSKIDTKLVADLGGNANTVVAVAVSQKLVKQLMDFASSFGGNMPQQYATALEPLDGTIAVAATLGPDNMKDFTGLGFKGSVQTSGKNNARLLQVLEPIVGKVQIDGNTFHFGNEGYGSGVAPLADVAKDFDGAWLGIAGAMRFSDRPPYYYFAATLTPADNSLSLNFKMNLK